MPQLCRTHAVGYNANQDHGESLINPQVQCGLTTLATVYEYVAG